MAAEKRIRQSPTCSKCGVFGHNSWRCKYENPAEKICIRCKILLKIDCFSKWTNPNNKIRYVSICKSCHSKRQKEKYTTDRNFRFKLLVNDAEYRAKKFNMDFNLTKEWIENQYKKQNGLCYYSGIPLSLERGKYSMSLDRVDSNKGYIQDNTVITGWMINNMKGDKLIGEFIDICGKIYLWSIKVSK